MRSSCLCLAVLPLFLGACAATAPSPSAQKVLSMPPTGTIPVEGGRVWYAVHGRGTRTPLLVLHGGPGIPHDYLTNLDRLGDERPVVFYDQLGCGQSERPDDPTLWTRERFARELGQVRKALGLDEVILYGHSWGTILAVDYMSGMGGAKPGGVRGLILAGPALDIPRWMADSRRLVAALPADARAAIEAGERTGKTDSDAYKAAMGAYYGNYVCRLDPWPSEVQHALETMGEAVYGTMNGPSEFTVTGTLKDVKLEPQLANLHLPVLYTCGEFDEATPDTTRAYAAATPGAEVAVIAGAAHVANYDKPVEYMATVRGWLARHGL
jgi:proline iminopeptidase